MTDAKNNDPKSLAMPREFVLQNGLRIVTLSTPTIDTARMKLIVNSGSRDDPAGEEGTAHLLEHMLFQGSYLRPGTPERSAAAGIQQTFHDWGGGFGAFTNKMSTTYGFDTKGMSVMYENLSEAADILLDMVQHPRIKEADVDRERPLIKTELATQGVNVSDLMDSATRASLYHNSGLEHLEYGNHESLDHIKAGNLREFWRKHYVPSNTVIMIQGKGTDEELLKIVTDKLTILGANNEKAPDHLPLKVVTDDTLCTPVNIDKAVYTFSWDVNRKDGPPLNEREVIIASAVQNILRNELYLKMRDKERLVYNCNAYTDITGAMVFRIDSDHPPDEVTKSFTDFMKDLNAHLNEKTLEKYKKSTAIRCTKDFQNPEDVAFDKWWSAAEGQKIYHTDDIVKMLQSITLDEVREMASRIFGKPFGMAVVGNPQFVAQVADNTAIAAAMNLTPNDKPIAGSFPMPDDITPYDPRHGQTEPLPNPAQPRKNIAAGR